MASWLAYAKTLDVALGRRTWTQDLDVRARPWWKPVDRPAIMQPSVLGARAKHIAAAFIA